MHILGIQDKSNCVLNKAVRMSLNELYQNTQILLVKSGMISRESWLLFVCCNIFFIYFDIILLKWEHSDSHLIQILIYLIYLLIFFHV